jgi:hypothetical protein
MPTPSCCDRLTLRVVLLKVSPLAARLISDDLSLEELHDIMQLVLAGGKCRIDEGRGPRSAACPFDGDHATVVLEILSRGKTADLIHDCRENELFDRKGC